MKLALAATAVTACGFQPHAVDVDASSTGSAMDAAADADPLSVGLIAWYPMEAITASTTEDATGNGHIATCAQCPTPVPAKRGMGFHFDGATRFDVADDGAFDTPGFTVAMWVRFDAPLSQGFGCPAGKVYDATIYNTWELCYAHDSTSWLFDTVHDNTQFDKLTAEPPPTPGAWYHVALTWDGDRKELWLDGDSVADDDDVQVAFAPGGAVTFGADTDNGGQQSSAFVGTMDELRIYDHALGSADIAALAAP